jgi:hypothetical protein
MSVGDTKASIEQINTVVTRSRSTDVRGHKIRKEFIKLGPVNGANFSAGSDFRIRFPTRGLLKNNTVRVNFDLTHTGTGTLPAQIEALFVEVRATSGNNVDIERIMNSHLLSGILATGYSNDYLVSNAYEQGLLIRAKDAQYSRTDCNTFRNTLTVANDTAANDAATIGDLRDLVVQMSTGVALRGVAKTNVGIPMTSEHYSFPISTLGMFQKDAILPLAGFTADFASGYSFELMMRLGSVAEMSAGGSDLTGLTLSNVFISAELVYDDIVEEQLLDRVKSDSGLDFEYTTFINHSQSIPGSGNQAHYIVSNERDVRGIYSVVNETASMSNNVKFKNDNCADYRINTLQYTKGTQNYPNDIIQNDAQLMSYFLTSMHKQNHVQQGSGRVNLENYQKPSPLNTTQLGTRVYGMDFQAYSGGRWSGFNFVAMPEPLFINANYTCPTAATINHFLVCSRILKIRKDGVRLE